MAQKTIYILDLKPNTIGREEIFSVKDIQRQQTKNGDPYYKVTLKDKTGTISARIWKDCIGDCDVDVITIGDAVIVDFECSSYNGETQMSIKKMKKSEDFEVIELMTGSDIDIEGLWKKLEGYIASIKDPDYKRLLLAIFADPQVVEAYKKTPAAEIVHHDFVGGLLQHVIEMLGMAESIIEFYPMADRDTVVTGIILHDIGKIYEIGLDQTTFIRTKLGYLIGHITIGIIMLNKYLPDNFDIDKKTLIEHIILSHHQEIEHGAVVKPATLEAAIVALVDRASSHIRQYEKEISLNTVDKQGFGRYMKYQQTKIFIGNKKNDQTVIVEEGSVAPPLIEVTDETLPF